MGKDLKGKELGVGISQRKDGLYTGRFVSKRTGKTVMLYHGSICDHRGRYRCGMYYADQ